MTIQDEIRRAVKPVAPPPASKLVTETAGGKWPTDWSAAEHAVSLINQGGSQGADGDYCCHPQATVQCQIQYQSGGGQRYMDYSNNRTRVEDLDGTIQVDDFKARMSMEVIHNGTHDVCKKYCPIDKEDTLDGGAAYFLDQGTIYITTYLRVSTEALRCIHSRLEYTGSCVTQPFAPSTQPPMTSTLALTLIGPRRR